MTLKPFAYTALRYRPSYLLGEEVNIALLFNFFQEEKISFIYPQQLSRIASFHPSANLPLLRKYLKGIERKLSTASKLITSEDSLGQLLVPDASSLYFSEMKQGRYQSSDEILHYYHNLYFGHYQKEKAPIRKDERYIQALFERALPATVSAQCQRGYVVETPIQKTSFEFAWHQEDTLHLAKCISLDLKREEPIRQKAFRWFGELSQLHKHSANAHLLVLLAKPQAPELGKVYTQALEVLQEAPVQVVEEEKVQGIASRVI